MALVIDNPETERLVEALVRKTGGTPADAIAAAIREQLRESAEQSPTQESEQERIRTAKAAIREIQHRIAGTPDVDTRSADEIIGYDEHGVPR